MMAKTIITAALTGAVTPKTANPNIPLTPKEIAEDAIRVWKEGAAVVHLHMRDDNGMGAMDLEKFRETVRLIRENTDLVINLTTSGGPTPDDESRFRQCRNFFRRCAPLMQEHSIGCRADLL